MREGLMRNVVFGVQDSLVSTVGLVSGVASADVVRSTLILAGVVLVFVEAFSMAVGSFLSDVSAREYRGRRAVRSGPSVLGGFVMFISYASAGFLVLAPYYVIPGKGAFEWSIGISLAALFLLGAVGARFSGLPTFNRGVRMVTLGGLAILLGITVARIIS